MGKALLKALLVAGGVMGLASGAAAQQSTPIEASASVQADEPGPQISRYIYGHFAEHLGRGIYEGVWVGEDSEIPNTNGYRNDVVAALKALQIPVVRWPGGCFADEYHWRDGIGPREERPVRVNTHWGWVEDDNSFGTHEFMNFAELIGADAYVAGNMGSGTPEEMAHWVEYMTGIGNTTLVEERRANGREEPWKVPFFGVGNESWGCGGNMRPEYSADLHNRYQTFIKTPPGVDITKVATGANVDDYNFTEVLMQRSARHMDALSLHYYTFTTGWEDKGDATGFTEAGWASVLKNALFMDELVTKHSAIMDKYDPEKRIGLYVDEWGTWFNQEEGSKPGFLYQQNSIRDALVAALTLDIFHDHADRVKMANIAQMVNVLQASVLTRGPEMILTPTYHVLQMYIPFQDATYIPVEVEAPDYVEGDITLPSVVVSAARATDGAVHLALVNLDPNRPARVSTTLEGVTATGATGQVLTGATIDAHNTFEQPNAVAPRPFQGQAEDGRLTFDLPARSVAVVELQQ